MVEDMTTKHKLHSNSNGALLTKSFTARSLRGQMFQKKKKIHMGPKKTS